MDLDRVRRGRLDAVGVGLADAAILEAGRGGGPAALLAVPHQIGGLADFPVFLGGGALRDDLGDGGGRRGAGRQGQGEGGRGERGQGDTVHTPTLITPMETASGAFISPSIRVYMRAPQIP
ncbi:hypothetical protein D3C71_1618310 [compost metagenome]